MKRPETGWIRYAACVGAGIALFLAAEFTDQNRQTVDKGILKRNPWGQGEAVYEFYAEGLEEGPLEMSVTVPSRILTGKEFHERMPEIAELLTEEILGNNPSLAEVREDLDLVEELPGCGILVEWESGVPELLSSTGMIDQEKLRESNGSGEQRVFLTAELFSGTEKEVLEIPVTILPEETTPGERLKEQLSVLAGENLEKEEVALFPEFEGRPLKYRGKGHFQNAVLLLLGIVAAVCLRLKETGDKKAERKRREESLEADYPDLVSGFLVLVGAGYSIRQAWKKTVMDRKKSPSLPFSPVYEEMQITLNQMETGTPEPQAYDRFGKRCGLRCYTRFAGLLESSLHTGGNSLRTLLDAEMEEAFKMRADLARRKGEEASTKLLFPMFGILGVVMVMVTAPAFFSLG